MFESIMNFFKKLGKNESKDTKSKETAKERLHLVLMQDRANVSADFLEMMKQEIIEVIKKYIEVDEKEIDVRLTNDVKEDGTTGAPSLYANIPIVNIKNEMKKELVDKNKEDLDDKKEDNENSEPDNDEGKETEEKKDNEEIKDEEESEKEDDRKDSENLADKEEKESEPDKKENIEEEKIEEQEENKEDKKNENNEDKSGE